MDKKEFFDSVIDMEAQLGKLYQQIGELKSYLAEFLEENNSLKLENEHLRKRLEQIENSQNEATSFNNKKNNNEETSFNQMAEIGVGHDNLARLYQEGFHICNVHFGSPRKAKEDCLFCLSFLSKK